MPAIPLVQNELDIGDARFIEGTITMASYLTDGLPLDISDHLSDVYFLFPKSRSGYVFTYDATNKKIKAFYFDYNALADGPAIEVANAVDLAAEVMDFFAIGMP